MLQELIQQLQKNHGLSAEQSSGIMATVSGFMKEKFPAMKSSIDAMNGIASTATEKKNEHSIMDKISDVIPGESGEKIENFAKGAAEKVEDVLDNVKDKLSGFFSGKK